MKYPITVTPDEVVIRMPRVASTLVASDALRFVLRHWAMFAAVAVTFIIHLPTLRYFFDGDDFVVLGSINYSGTSGYITDTFLLRDIVPNWRPLTGVVYAIEWRIFGMEAMGWRATNLALHLASVAVLYTLVFRVTKRPMVGGIAAMIFGISGAHFDTVTYVTALPHVMATLFMLSSLLAIVAYVQGAERKASLYWLGFGLFALAFLSNEGHFVYAPVIVAAYALFARRWHSRPLRLVLHGAPFALLAGGWLTYYQFFAGDQLKFEGYYWGGHVFSNYAVYLSWLVLPIRAIPGDPDNLRSAIAGGFIVFSAFIAWRGPTLARVGVLGIALALLPYAPVEIWTASRYTYAAVAFFAPIAAISAYYVFDRVRSAHPYARIPATIIGVFVVAAVATLYGMQTYAQDARTGRATDRWQLLVNELQTNYDTVPDGTTIWIVDGPWTNPMEQYTWVPSVARAVYGDAAAFNLPRGQFEREQPATENALFLEWVWGTGLVPVAPHQVFTPSPHN